MNTKYITFFLTLLFLASAPALAAPPNTATLDGRPYEYDGSELWGTNTEPPHDGPDNVIKNLFVTWDTDALYVMLQGWENGDKLAVLIDVDPGYGTGATTTTNWMNTTESRIDWNGLGWVAGPGPAFGLDYMLASEGQYNNINRVLYDGAATPSAANVEEVFDEGNGGNPEGTPVDMVIQADGTSCELKGFEVRIPWAELYNDSRFGTPGPGGVPVGAALRLFANIHENSENVSYSYSNAIPEQASGSWSAGLLTTTSYIDIIVDGDNDGAPDVASGDVNAPFIVSAAGGDGGTTVFVSFNEPTTPGTAGVAANYIVDGLNPVGVTIESPTLVQLDLAAALPSEGSLVTVQSTGVQDASANAKANAYCLTVGPAGIPSPVTVTFVLNTNSGMAVSHGISGVFLNSETPPLEEGFPPAMSTPLAPASGAFYATTVVFPVGTPMDVGYRYSALLPNGTNNYEAVRLDNYAFERRWLTLNESGMSMVVTDTLGAAASPLRQGDEGYAELYVDPRRGDAGFSERTTMLFQLDLSQRYLGNVSRVLLLGFDPLRGFNVDDFGFSDWPGDSAVGWGVGGIEMFDDGPAGGHGDLVLTDGVYSVTWAGTDDGYDPLLVPGLPHALVGGDEDTDPYAGDAFWENRRSPRSFELKYAVVVDGEAIDDPPGEDNNIDVYVQPSEGTDIVFAPFVWDNDDLPKLAAAFPADIVEIYPDGADTKVVYTNIRQAPDNSIEMAEEATAAWENYGLEGVGSANIYTATVTGVTNDTQVFRVVTPSYPSGIVWWTPNPVNPGDTVRLHYNQIGRPLAGERALDWPSSINGWGSPPDAPLTFTSNGNWYVDIEIPTSQTDRVFFKIADASHATWQGNASYGDNNYRMELDGKPVSWTPERPSPGGTITITYDATGRNLAGASQVYIHYGFGQWDGGTWAGGTTPPGTPMTPTGTSNEWSVVVPVPAEYDTTVDFVFNDGSTWDNNDSQDWHAFIEP